jgi:hypothetical protein
VGDQHPADVARLAARGRSRVHARHLRGNRRWRVRAARQRAAVRRRHLERRLHDELDYHDALLDAGVESDTIVADGVGHGWIDAAPQAIVEWFDRHGGA